VPPSTGKITTCKSKINANTADLNELRKEVTGILKILDNESITIRNLIEEKYVQAFITREDNDYKRWNQYALRVNKNMNSGL